MNELYMKEALKEAKKAYELGEIPVGTVIVYDNQMIAKAHNRKEIDKNPLSHAEINAILKANKKVNDWRLNECTLYTTLFPCPMCAGAIQQARIQKIYYILESSDVNSLELAKSILKMKGHIVQYEKLDIDEPLLKKFFLKIRTKNVSRETLKK